MTIYYNDKVATVTGFGIFWKLLFRWRGSIYKLLWRDMLLYCTIYLTLSVTYRCLPADSAGKAAFESVAIYCHQHIESIPLTFVLGFYVNIVVTRWWDQYTYIPWPDSLALYVTTCIHGHDERALLMRRTIMRYANLTLVLSMRLMCTQIIKRFPTLNHLVEAGFLQENEKEIFEELDEQTPLPKYWMPLVWAASIVSRARKEGRIHDDYATNMLLNELCTFRGLCGSVLNYDWISIPLVYTQVVTLAVYMYCITSLMGRQFIDTSLGIEGFTNDCYFPFFALLQFFFYMGWLKVAEVLINPFGEDDEDFEINWLVDRNIAVSYLIVDEMHHEHPELVKDQYWDEVFPSELPYTADTEAYRKAPPAGSTSLMDEKKLLTANKELNEQKEKEEKKAAMTTDSSGTHHHAATAPSEASLKGNKVAPSKQHLLVRTASGQHAGSSDDLSHPWLTNVPSGGSAGSHHFGGKRHPGVDAGIHQGHPLFDEPVEHTSPHAGAIPSTMKLAPQLSGKIPTDNTSALTSPSLLMMDTDAPKGILKGKGKDEETVPPVPSVRIIPPEPQADSNKKGDAATVDETEEEKRRKAVKFRSTSTPDSGAGNKPDDTTK